MPAKEAASPFYMTHCPRTSKPRGGFIKAISFTLNFAQKRPLFTPGMPRVVWRVNRAACAGACGGALDKRKRDFKKSSTMIVFAAYHRIRK